MTKTHEYLIVNEVRLTLRVKAENPNDAVRLARQTEHEKWDVGDKDEIEVWPEDGSSDEFDWTVIENEIGAPNTAELLA